MAGTSCAVPRRPQRETSSSLQRRLPRKARPLSRRRRGSMREGTGCAKVTGARTTMARSTSFSARKARAVAGPPSTIKRVTPYLLSRMSSTSCKPRKGSSSSFSWASATKKRERCPSVRTVASRGVRRRGSSTTRSGCGPRGDTRRTVKDGSSRSTVLTPTSTASEQRRRRCAASKEAPLVKRCASPDKSSTPPLKSTASFSVTSPLHPAAP
mmetsp:Transcript_906/g.2563  ORF Transcript_906/g.2563 Transcript_906/m.2563 type:complete len:212 (-) Transcript_906:75-710(-)